MNRHHPYGGYDGPRRGGPPGHFGPDRPHRFSDRGGPPRGRGGFRGGRGGGGHFGGFGGGGPPPYDQGPPQGDAGGYSGYDSGPPQDQYYQNGSFNGAMPEQFGPPDSYDYNNQGFGSYEDGPGNFGHGGGFGRGGKRGGFARREKEDKVHDSIIEERIQRERPCRTLFIRNIKYETNSEDVRHLFEEHGEIRTFFDLIANRGMVFVTYYDLRAAERARDHLQGSEISGRPIDVHYSLPRDDQKGADKDKSQQLQGTLLVTLRNSPSGQPIDDNEVRRKFQQFGDVKDVRPVGERPDQRYVEFYDTRACEEAHDRLRHQGLQDGVMDIVFASDLDDPRAQSPRRGGGGPGGGAGGPPFERGNREWDDFGHRGRRGHGGHGGHGGHHHGHGGRGRGRGRGGWGNDGGDWDRKDWGRSGDREQRGGRVFQDEYGRGAGRGGGFDNRFDQRGPGGPGGFGGPPPPPPPAMGGPGHMGPGPFGGPPPPMPPTFAPPPPAPVSPPDERLEQAKKVQQLLAALKQPGQPVAPASNLAGPPPTQPPMPPTPTQNTYYPPPVPAGYPAAIPPSGGPGAYPPPQSVQGLPQSGAPGAPGLPNMPPNIMALLQKQGSGPAPQASPPPPAHTNMPSNTYSMPPQAPSPGALPMPPNGQQGYAQLMAYLSQKRS